MSSLNLLTADARGDGLVLVSGMLSRMDLRPFLRNNSAHCGQPPPKGRFDLDEQVRLGVDNCNYNNATLNKEMSQDPNPLLNQAKSRVFLSVTAVSYGFRSRVE